MSNGLISVINYLIPNTGASRAYVQSSVLTSTPVFIDFNAIAGGGLDAQPFRPSGVFIDNTQGTGVLTVVINQTGYQMQCPAGASLNAQFPSPMNVTVNITGTGQATLVFVDFPVMPYRSF